MKRMTTFFFLLCTLAVSPLFSGCTHTAAETPAVTRIPTNSIFLTPTAYPTRAEAATTEKPSPSDGDSSGTAPSATEKLPTSAPADTSTPTATYTPIPLATKPPQPPVTVYVPDTPKRTPFQLNANAVFVGDSLLESLTLYGVLPEATYLVKIGLNIYSIQTDSAFLTKDGKVSGLTALNTLSPDTIYLLLGTNGLGWAEPDVLIREYRKWLAQVKETLPNTTIVLLSVTPVTRYCEEHPTEDEALSVQAIERYNALQRQMAQDLNLYYIDITGGFSDAYGYLASEYAETDGIHWTPKGCLYFAELLRSALTQLNGE